MTEKSSGIWIENVACIDCDSSDALGIYEQDNGTYTGYCRGAGCDDNDPDMPNRFKSNNKLADSEYAEEYGIERIGRKRGRKEVSSVTDKPQRRKRKAKKKEASPISEQEKSQVLENTSESGGGFRGIDDKWLKYYRVRTAYDEETGEVSDRYYPIIKGKDESGLPRLVGYHRRFVLPEKTFRPVGLNSKECELFGMFRCKPGGKYLLIAGGQEDVMAAKQMFEDYREEKGKDKIAPIDVVSSTVGETSCASQCQYHFDFIDSYDNVIIDMDEDTAGENALQSLLEVLPMNKVRILVGPAKDANGALQEGLEYDYIRAFYAARKPRLTGIVSGLDMLAAMRETVSKPVIPLPFALKPLQEKLYGGLPTEEIINILAASGVGKTTITNLLELYWIFHSPYKIGVMSLEAGAGKFLVRLASSYLKKNIAHLTTPEAKLQFIDDNEEDLVGLFLDEEGEERFCLVDDKGEVDSLAEAKRTIEKMIRQGGCKIIIIDPLQDLLDTLTIEDQAAFVGWQKKLKARDGVTFINVNHTRKSGGGKKAGSQGGELTEEDMQGTSAIYKSGAVNIIISRDKTAECDEERNTTKVNLTKSRDAGETGPAGELYYEIETATLHNKAEWVKQNAEDY